MRLVFTGGGTGGHIMPNLAMIEEIREKGGGEEILYVGGVKSMEKRLAEKFGVKFVGIWTGKLRRYWDWRNFVDVFKVLVGVLQSIWILLKFKPDMVISKGGFVGLPVVLAAGVLRKRVVLHESDFRPGLSNRISAKFAEEIWVNFEGTKEFFLGKKVVVKGIPVLKKIVSGTREKGLKLTGLSGKLPVVLVMGGSQGALVLNEAICNQIEKITNEFEIIHLTGIGKKVEVEKWSEKAKKRYFQMEFANDEIGDLYKLADIIISRAGASSLADIRAVEKVAILVPLSKKVSRGDQIENAREFLKERGEDKVVVVQEENLGDLFDVLRSMKSGFTV